MKTRTGSFVRSACVATLGVLAALHPERAEAAPPAWCKAEGVKHIDHSTAFTEAFGNPDPEEAMIGMVGAICLHDGERTKEVEAARARWNKRLDLTDADWGNDVVVYATQEANERKGGIAFDEKRPWSALDPIDQYAVITRTASESADPDYVTDALEGRLSETGRLAYIRLCVEPGPRAGGGERVVEWALCQADIDALDRKKLNAEIHADKAHSGIERMKIRIALAKLEPKLVAHAATVKQYLAKDAGYAKLFSVAADARKSWRADARLLAVALAMDDARIANSKKAFEGCDDATWAAFQQAVSAVPAKKFAGLKAGSEFREAATGVLINDVGAYLASTALFACRQQTPDILIDTLAKALLRWPGFRGPRNAALTTLLTSDVSLDDRDTKIEFPKIYRKWLTTFYNDGMGGGDGRVDSVKASGGKTVVTFVKKTHKEKVCDSWKDTNQIVQINPSGSVVYGYNCLKYGTVTITDSPEPQTVNSRYSGGVKPGLLVSTHRDLVTGVWPKSGEVPSAVFGVPVK